LACAFIAQPNIAAFFGNEVSSIVLVIRIANFTASVFYYLNLHGFVSSGLVKFHGPGACPGPGEWLNGSLIAQECAPPFSTHPVELFVIIPIV